MKKRNIVLILLVALGVITFLDRLNIAVAANYIIDDLSLSDKQWGWILSIFTLSYGLFQIPLGLWGDKKGQHLVLTVIVVWWSVFTGLTGAAGGFVSLLVIRFMFGLGEAGGYPNMTGAVSKWFPKSEVGKAQGWIWAASRFGGALAPITVIPLMALVGWRITFMIFGGVGIIWGALWYFWYRDNPTKIKGISASEIDEISKNRDVKNQIEIPWNNILKSKQFWLILSMYWFYVWGSWFFFSWFPKFLENGRGFEGTWLKYGIAIPFMMGVLGNISGGYLSDKWAKKFGLKTGRRLLGVGGLAISSIFMFLGGFIHDKVSVFIFMSLCFGIMDMMLPSAWAICIDVGKKYAGAISGAMNTAGNLGGFVCISLFAYLKEIGGSYDLPLFVISGMLMVAAILFLRINPENSLIEDKG